MTPFDRAYAFHAANDERDVWQMLYRYGNTFLLDMLQWHWDSAKRVCAVELERAIKAVDSRYGQR